MPSKENCADVASRGTNVDKLITNSTIFEGQCLQTSHVLNRWYPPTAKQKLALGWTGPYKVVRKVTDIVHSVQKSPCGSFET